MLNLITVESPKEFLTLQTTNLPSEVECKYGTISSIDECMVHHLPSSKEFVDKIRNGLDNNIVLNALLAKEISENDYQLCKDLGRRFLRWRYDLHDK